MPTSSSPSDTATLSRQKQSPCHWPRNHGPKHSYISPSPLTTTDKDANSSPPLSSTATGYLPCPPWQSPHPTSSTTSPNTSSPNGRNSVEPGIGQSSGDSRCGKVIGVYVSRLPRHSPGTSLLFCSADSCRTTS